MRYLFSATLNSLRMFTTLSNDTLKLWGVSDRTAWIQVYGCTLSIIITGVVLILCAFPCILWAPHVSCYSDDTVIIINLHIYSGLSCSSQGVYKWCDATHWFAEVLSPKWIQTNNWQCLSSAKCALSAALQSRASYSHMVFVVACNTGKKKYARITNLDYRHAQ